MNMISTGTFLPEMDASNKQETLAEKFAAVWEKKNSKAARAGGVSLMALSLAACGSSSDDTTTVVEEPVVEEPVVEEPTTPVVNELALTTSSTDETTGTAGADSITGAVSALSAVRTLQVTDTIDGGDGSDTLELQLDSAFTGFTTGSMTGVEVVNITNTGSTSRNFDMSGVTGVEEINLTGEATVSDVAAIASVSAGARDTTLTIGYAAAAVEGSSDVQTLSITDFGTADDADTDADETAAVDISIASTLETTDLTVSGTNVITGASLASKNITATGEGSLEVAAFNAGTKTFDASGVTGDVTLTTTAGLTSATSIKTGAGDDSVTIGVFGDDIVANAVLAGGDGDDTLVIKGTNTTQLYQTGFETMNFDALGGAVTMSMANSSGVDTLIASKSMNDDVALSSVGAQAMTINLQGPNAADKGISSDHTGATTITLDTPASGATSTAPSTNVLDVTVSKSTSVDFDIAAKMDYEGVVTAAKAESVVVSIDGTASGAAEVSAATATSLTIDSVATASALKLTAAKATELTVDGAKALDTGAHTLTALEYVTITGAGGADFSGGDLANAVSIDSTTTGDVDFKDIGTTDLENSLTISVLNSKSLDIVDVATKGENITITATDSAGAIGIGAVNAGATGNVDITASAATTFGVGAVTGNNVDIDLSGVVGAATVGGDITVAGNLTYVGTQLEANDLSDSGAQNVVLDSDVNVIDFTGGIAADKLDIDNDTTTTSLTVKGDFGLGTDAVIINMSAAVQAADVTVDVTGMSNYNTLALTASAAKTTTVKLGSGSEVDTITYNAADQKITVTGFQTDSTDDVIVVEKTGGGDIAAKTGILANAAAADIAAETAIVFADGSDGAGTEAIADYADLTDVAAFINAGLTLLTTETFMVFINDLANDMVYAYNVVEGSGASADTTIDADEVVSLGSIALADADIAFTVDNVSFTA